VTETERLKHEDREEGTKPHQDGNVDLCALFAVFVVRLSLPTE